MARHKQRKFAELATLDNFYFQPENMQGKWNSLCFKNTNPIVLELGCGKGEYTNNLGAKFPDKNFIGVDLKGVRLWRAAKNALDNKLNNVAFLQINIDNIEDYFAEEEVSEIWIPFPDPYPKPSKWKKRLISSKFLTKYKRILQQKGILHFKTDNTPLFEFAKETLDKDKHSILQITDNLHESDLLNEYNSIPTYFEGLFRDKGETIKYIKFQLK
ncbi:MAG: tRNA (guanosine(46)-N7)-methyltransferase TrmB [Cytophagia bacterium]|nr:tRNA (guanosine(46)-N7)-methyltransferase TrmB [Cytophagia bacterium]